MRNPKELPAYTIVQLRNAELGYVLPGGRGMVKVIPSDDTKPGVVLETDRVMVLLAPDQAIENYIHIMHGPASY